MPEGLARTDLNSTGTSFNDGVPVTEPKNFGTPVTNGNDPTQFGNPVTQGNNPTQFGNVINWAVDPEHFGNVIP